MEKRRVVITGLGTVNPLGNNTADSWAAAKAGKCGIGPITQFDTTDFKCKLAGEVKGFDPETIVDKKEARKMARFTVLALAAAAEAVADSGLDTEAEAKQIGVILPKLSSESCARMVEGISRVLDEQGYQLLLVNTANDNTREVRAMDMLRHDAVDGIILIASIFTPEHEAVLESLKIPVVILGQQHPGYSCVYHDDFGAARAATARMLEKGRRLPGFLGATMLDKAVGQARRAGYEAALRDAGLMPRAQRISVAKFNMESGYEQARQLFERAGEINALFCATDTIAIGAIQYCRSQGLRVPEDVMVASVGDSRAGRVAYVPLTSAHLHYRTAGDKAARLLLDQLADPHARPRELELGWELKCRASTGDENADENIWAL